MTSISFTKLGTIKSSGLEYTYQDYFKGLLQAIKNNPGSAGVKYDEENNRYIIRRFGYDHEVLYGDKPVTKNCENKEIVETLDELVKITTNSSSIDKTIDKKIGDFKRYKQKIVENGKLGILNSPEEKAIFIDYLKNDDKSHNHKIAKSILESLKKLYIWKENPATNFVITEGLMGIAILFFGTLAAAAWFWETVFRNLVFIVGGAFVGDVFITCGLNSKVIYPNDSEQDYPGLLASLFASLLVPFIIGKNVIRRVIEKIRVNKKTSLIQKSMNGVKMDTKSSKKDYAGLDINQALEKAIEETNENTETKDVDLIIQKMGELKDNIELVSNETEKSKYIKELSEIIAYYADAYKNFNDEKKATLYKKVYDLIMDLNIRVRENLQNEKRITTFDNECNALLDEIQQVKSIGTR